LDILAPNVPQNLDYTGTIICSLGARYKAYCSDVARTYFIDPTDDQKEAYAILCEIHDRIIQMLKPGIKLRDIWKRAVGIIEITAPSLRQNFLSSCGTSIGLEFSDSELTIDDHCDKVVVSSMVFNVRIGFKNLRKADSRMYSMLLGDTVLVGANGAEVLTSKCTHKFSEVSYELGPGDEKDEKKIDKRTIEPKGKGKNNVPVRRTPPPSAPQIKKEPSLPKGDKKKSTKEFVNSVGFSLTKKRKTKHHQHWSTQPLKYHSTRNETQQKFDGQSAS